MGARSWQTLFLPTRDARVTWGTASVVFAYTWLTSARDLSFYDSPELALVAHQLGLGHPIGQPLHTLLGFLASHVPGLSPLVGLSGLSALTLGLAMIPALSLSDAFVSESLDSRSARLVRAFVLVCAALHFPVWEGSSRVEVYALATFVLLWAAAHAAHVFATRDRVTPKSLLALGVALGLGASANAYLAAILGCALIVPLIQSLRSQLVSLRSLGALVGGGFAGLLPYAYVPLAARRDDVLVWGAPSDGDSLLRYFRGAEYAHNRGITPEAFFANFAEWLSWSATSGVFILALIGITATVKVSTHIRRARWVGPLTLALTVLLLCSHAVFATDIADYIDYLMLGLLLLAAGTAALASRLWLGTPRDRGVGISLACIVAVAALAPSPNLVERTRWNDRAARVIALSALDEAPQGAILIVASDHLVAPLLYIQEVEHHRRDVIVLAYGLASSSWYWRFLLARHPDAVPMPLAGEGGKRGRVLRFAAANRARSLHIQSPELAREVGLPFCDVGVLLRVGRACRDSLSATRATRALADAMNTIDRGSPSSDGALAQVALERGEALWRLGRPASAMHAMLAGVPPSSRPRMPAIDATAWGSVLPFTGEFPAWRQRAALGDPRRNLLFAAAIAEQAGSGPARNALLQQARDLGLIEAH